MIVGAGSFGDANHGVHTDDGNECGTEFEVMFSRGTDERIRSSSRGGLEHSRVITRNNGGINRDGGGYGFSRSSGHGRNRICTRYCNSLIGAIGGKFVDIFASSNEGSEYIDVEHEGIYTKKYFTD